MKIAFYWFLKNVQVDIVVRLRDMDTISSTRSKAGLASFVYIPLVMSDRINVRL